MNKNNIFFVLLVVFLVFGCTQQPPIGSENYLDGNAKVMYFFRAGCHWCEKQQEILKSLALEGYRVKPVSAENQSDMFTKNGVLGTPTFMGPDGTKLVGYQEKEALKKFLDKYKD